jgi:hypothetical protein
MIIIPWEIALAYGLTLFGFGFGLGVIPFIIAIAREAKHEANAALPTPHVNTENVTIKPSHSSSRADQGRRRSLGTVTAAADEADTVSMADAVEQIHDMYFQAFRAMPHKDRLSSEGAQVAHVCDRLWKKAHEQIKDAWLVARGKKVVSLADPETQACTLELIEDVKTLDSLDPNPTDPTLH